jgi:hypothetical protein
MASLYDFAAQICTPPYCCLLAHRLGEACKKILQIPNAFIFNGLRQLATCCRVVLRGIGAPFALVVNRCRKTMHFSSSGQLRHICNSQEAMSRFQSLRGSYCSWPVGSTDVVSSRRLPCPWPSRSSNMCLARRRPRFFMRPPLAWPRRPLPDAARIDHEVPKLPAQWWSPLDLTLK